MAMGKLRNTCLKTCVLFDCNCSLIDTKLKAGYLLVIKSDKENIGQ